MSFLFGHVDGCLIHGFGCCFLTDGFDVAAFVVEVFDVDVDNGQTNFFHFRGDGVIYFGHECLSVLIDFFNLHGCNDGTHLTEDDVLCLALNLIAGKAQEANGRILHDAGLVGDGRCDRGGHGYADVFL